MSEKPQKKKDFMSCPHWYHRTCRVHRNLLWLSGSYAKSGRIATGKIQS